MFITKNGKGDLAVLSIEAYEKLCGKFELYSLLYEDLLAEKTGKVKPAAQALDEFGKELFDV